MKTTWDMLFPCTSIRFSMWKPRKKYQYIVGTDGRKLVRCTITKLERELTSYHFFRIHRGYLVNFRYVYRIDTGHVILDNGEKLPLSRHRRKEALQLFFGYIR